MTIKSKPRVSLISQQRKCRPVYRLSTEHTHQNLNQPAALDAREQQREALNVRINTRDDIIRDSHGSFRLAQMLCRETCLNLQPALD